MSHTQHLSLIAISVLLLSGCLKAKQYPAPDPSIMQQYFITYDKTGDSTTAAASFFHAGGGSGLVVNDTVITANGLQPTNGFNSQQVSWVFKGLPDVRFVFRNKGRSLVNELTLAEAGDIDFGPDVPDEIDRNSGFKFSWIGSPVDSGENMIVELVPVIIPTKDGPFGAGGLFTGKVCTFNTSDLAKLEPGNYYLVLRRDRFFDLDMADGKAAGIMTTTITVEHNIVLK